MYNAEYYSAWKKRSFIHHSQSTSIYVDIRRLLAIEIFWGKLYCLSVITAPQRYVRVDLLRKRADHATDIHDYIAWMERNAEESTKKIYCDNAPELDALKSGLRKLKTEPTIETLQSCSKYCQSPGRGQRFMEFATGLGKQNDCVAYD